MKELVRVPWICSIILLLRWPWTEQGWYVNIGPKPAPIALCFWKLTFCGVNPVHKSHCYNKLVCKIWADQCIWYRDRFLENSDEITYFFAGPKKSWKFQKSNDLKLFEASSAYEVMKLAYQILTELDWTLLWWWKFW